MRCLTTAAILAVAFAVPVHAEELSGTLKKIKDTGAITLGIRDSAVPFSYIDDKQKIVGYAVDICMKIVDEIKAELKLDKLEVNENIVTSSTRIPLMANGTVDLECGSTTNNADRQKQVWFTNTHFLTASRFLSKKALKLDQVDDLKGKAVVSVSGTTNITQLNKANAARSLGITVMNAKDVPEAFLMVETDRAQAFVMDDIQLAAMITSSKDSSLYAIAPAHFPIRSLMASCCARTARPLRPWSIGQLQGSTRAPRSRKSTANGSWSRCRRAAPTSRCQCRPR